MLKRWVGRRLWWASLSLLDVSLWLSDVGYGWAGEEWVRQTRPDAFPPVEHEMGGEG